MNNLAYDKIRETFKLSQTIRELSKADKRFGFDLPFDMFVYAMSVLTPQAYGVRLENYIIEKHNLHRVASKEGCGDFKDALGQNYELKISLITTTNECLNMVQIRPWQDVAGYLMVAIDTRTEPVMVYAFQLSKQQLLEEIGLLNATPAHGTVHVNKNHDKVEMRMSIPISDGNRHFLRWKRLYFNKDLSKEFVGSNWMGRGRSNLQAHLKGMGDIQP